MAKYYYKSRDRTGVITNGNLHAANPWQARKVLNKSHLTVISLSRFDLKLMIADLRIGLEKMTSKISFEEKMVLLNQLETGISVGIPIVQMLHLLQKDTKNKLVKEALQKITDDIVQGDSLHVAFAKHPKLFDATVVGLVKTGELSGRLEATLSRITSMIEQQAVNQAKVKSAIFYPKIVLFVMIAVLIVVVYFIIPKLKVFLSTFGADLPPVTRFVLDTSDFFVSYWYAILLFGFGIRFAFLKAVSTPEGKYRFDSMKFKAPLVGKIFINLEINNLCVILDLLIDSGVDLLSSLEILKESQKNELLKEALTGCQKEISKGGTFLNGLESYEVFPSTFTSMVGIGEESGLMQPVLKRLGRYYQLQIDYQLDNLSKLIEPVLLFLIFVVVLIIVLAVMMPIWSLSAGKLR